MVFKISKNTFFPSLFQPLKKALKKRGFCDFKDHFDLSDVQTTLKNIARILYNFCILEFWKKTHKFFKIGKTRGNTLEGLFWYGEIMSLQLKDVSDTFAKRCFFIKKKRSQFELQKLVLKIWRRPSIHKASIFPKNSLVSIPQPRAHSCTRKPRPRPRSDRVFWNLYLNGVDKSARSVRGSARTLMYISNWNTRDNLDACGLLDHFSNLKSEETNFIWVWRIFKKFQFWKFWNFLKFWKFGVFWRGVIWAFVMNLYELISRYDDVQVVKQHLFIPKNPLVVVMTWKFAHIGSLQMLIWHPVKKHQIFKISKNFKVEIFWKWVIFT